MASRTAIGLAAGCILLASHGLAEGPLDAAAAWELFTDVCGRAVVAPEEAKAYAVSNGWQGKVIATEDGRALIGWIMGQDWIDDDQSYVNVAYQVERYSGGMIVSCTLEANGFDSPPLPGIYAIAESHVAALLGDGYEMHGGALIGPKKSLGKLAVYSTPGFPPEKVLRAQESDHLATLSLIRLAPGKED
jgi:hypothetical protein